MRDDDDFFSFVMFNELNKGGGCLCPVVLCVAGIAALALGVVSAVV